MILAGLWCSTQKPPTFTFFEPVLTVLRNLDENGMVNSIMCFNDYNIFNILCRN